MDELLAGRERMSRVSAEFLVIDLETAMTFVEIARRTRDVLRRRRNCRAARRAYETVAKFADRVELSIENRRIVRVGLAQLRTELERLGETF